MPPRAEPTDRAELLQGTLDLVVLQTLRWGPRHGYGIARLIQTHSDDLLRVETGSLYPALHRLERKGWIEASWKVSETGQRVREYQLTGEGLKQLASERGRWERLAEAMSLILERPKEVPS
jgi:PadR family transcriptional regulator, regulatory protein PadR